MTKNVKLAQRIVRILTDKYPELRPRQEQKVEFEDNIALGRIHDMENFVLEELHKKE